MDLPKTSIDEVVPQHVSELFKNMLSESGGSVGDEMLQQLLAEEVRKRVLEELTLAKEAKRKASAALPAAKKKKKRKRVSRRRRARTVRRRGEMKPEDFAWWKLLHHPDVADRTSTTGKTFRRRFRVTFDLFQQIVKVMKPLMGIRECNNGGVESIPFEIKVLACLRTPCGTGIMLGND